VTELLKAMGQGDEKAADALLPLVYAELHRHFIGDPSGLTKTSPVGSTNHMGKFRKSCHVPHGMIDV
jgi:hypothetical protein